MIASFQEYSEDSNSEPDVDLENQYYNSKSLKEDDPKAALNSFQKVHFFLLALISFIISFLSFFFFSLSVINYMFSLSYLCLFLRFTNLLENLSWFV